MHWQGDGLSQRQFSLNNASFGVASMGSGFIVACRLEKPLLPSLALSVSPI